MSYENIITVFIIFTVNKITIYKFYTIHVDRCDPSWDQRELREHIVHSLCNSQVNAMSSSDGSGHHKNHKSHICHHSNMLCSFSHEWNKYHLQQLLYKNTDQQAVQIESYHNFTSIYIDICKTIIDYWFI